MDGATLALVMAAAAAISLIWWGLRASPIGAGHIDQRADAAFRERTGRKKFGPLS